MFATLAQCALTVQDGGASYQGSSEAAKVDEWLKQGASDNHYYCTSDAAQKPVRAKIIC